MTPADRKTGRFSVGIDPTNQSAVELAIELAESVSSRIEMGEIRTVITGQYTDAAIRQLRDREDIAYVEQESAMEPHERSQDSQ